MSVSSTGYKQVLVARLSGYQLPAMTQEPSRYKAKRVTHMTRQKPDREHTLMVAASTSVQGKVHQ